MRRRLSALLPLLALALGLLVAPAAADVVDGRGSDVVDGRGSDVDGRGSDVDGRGSDVDDAVAILAADADGEPVGPSPAGRTSEGNPAGELGAYERLETPFTWAASFILLFAGVVGLVVGAGLYQVLVRGPRQREAAGN